MAITRIITHKIQKLSPSEEAKLQLAEEESTVDGKLEECARELKLAFIAKQGKLYGRFSSDTGDHPLSSIMGEMIEKKLSFVSFSHTAMKYLKSEIDKTEDPVEAHVFFVEEFLEGSEVLYIFVVHHSAGVCLDGELQLMDSQYLDTKGVKLAARVNLREWQGEDNRLNYLSVLPWRGEKNISDAFVFFTGFTDKVDVKAETEAFLDIVTEYTGDQPEEVAQETKANIVSYCLEQHKQGRPVVIEELSSQVNAESKKEFEAYVHKRQESPKKEIIPDAGQLKQFVRISGRNESLSMSFSAKCLGESIIYNETDDTLVIQNLPKSLKNRLVKHLKN